MKILLLCFALLTSLFSTAQKSEVIADSAQTKSQLFSKSLSWISSTWRNSEKVIDLKDESAGMIVIKGALKTVPVTLGIKADGQTLTTITLRVKDGKAKIEFADTYFKSSIGTLWVLDDDKNPKQKEKWRKPLMIEMDEMIESYREALLKKIDDF